MKGRTYFVLVEVSNRHVHLSREHLDILFGKGYILTPKHYLSQIGEFAAMETVDVEWEDQRIEHVRIVGPAREHTQVELLAEDCQRLYGKLAPTNLSSDLSDTFGAILVGLEGKVQLPSGVMIASNHLHLATQDERYFGLKSNDVVRVEVNGHIFEDIVVRRHETFRTAVHVDKTEAKKANITDVCVAGKLYV